MSPTEEEREVRRTSPFTDEVVEEGALEIDEGVLESVFPLIPHLSPLLMQLKERERSAFGEL